MRPIVALALGIGIVAGTAHEVVAQQAATPADPPPAPHVRSAPKSLPGTRVDVFSTIQGNAIDSSDAVLPNSLVRLRDARMGHIVDTQVTDKSGVFSFFKVDPGFYLVELFDKSQQTLAASPLITTGAGAMSKTSVRLPASSSLLASLFMLGSQGQGAAGTVSGLGPVVTQVPTGVLQSIPAIVPAGDPASER